MKISRLKIKLLNLLKDKFLSATILVFLGSGFVNAGNYLYHLLMGRALGASMYGALESVISVLYILTVPTLTITLVVVKFVSSHKGAGDKKAIETLYSYFLSKIAIFGSVFVLLLLMLSPFVQSFLHLPSIFLALLLPLTFFINIVYALNKSVIQGVSQFFQFSLMNCIEAVVKILLALALVYLGFRVEGAFGAIVISLLVGGALSFLYVNKLVPIKINLKNEYPHSKDLVKFILPTFFTTLALTSIFTTDVILVRHFFPGVESGYYSALSILGKIIYFAAAPIVLVIFPMVSEHHARGENYTRFLFLGTAITILASLSVTIIYFAVPNTMIELLFGLRYLPAAGMLGLFGIFISIYSLCALLSNFYLSIHKTFPSVLVGAAAIVQIAGIYFFHENINEIISINIGITFLLLISLLLYYPRASKHPKI